MPKVKPDEYTVCDNVDVKKRWVLYDHDDESIAVANTFDSQADARDNEIAQLDGVSAISIPFLTVPFGVSFPLEFLLRVDAKLLRKQIEWLYSVEEKRQQSGIGEEDDEAVNGIVELLLEIQSQLGHVYAKTV